MRPFSKRSFLALSASLLLAGAFSLAPVTAADEAYKVSGPFVHENLAIYLIHDASAEGPVPLTLSEALDKGLVVVSETGNVNELQIENAGEEPVFVQSGDIVKGGRQDRVFTTSLLLKPHSGKMPIDAFCVEHGRWSGRANEAADHFASSNEAMPSKVAKLAMKAPLESAGVPTESFSNREQGASPDETGVRQQAVWSEVANAQSKLSAGVGEAVASADSETSLQLALENKKLEEAQTAYVTALEGVASEGDVIGYVFAINGKLNSADIYPSNGLFKKMWKKLLSASATEAIGEKGNGGGQPTPSSDEVLAFLSSAEAGKSEAKPVNDGTELETRDSDKAVYFETRAAASGDSKEDKWVHKNYLAK